MKTNKWYLAWMVLGTALCLVMCVTLVVCVVEIAVKLPLALLGALFCGSAFFVLLGDIIKAALEVYNDRNKSKKEEEEA